MLKSHLHVRVVNGDPPVCRNSGGGTARFGAPAVEEDVVGQNVSDCSSRSLVVNVQIQSLAPFVKVPVIVWRESVISGTEPVTNAPRMVIVADDVESRC